MDPEAELLKVLSAALTRGQGDFTMEDLHTAFEEVYNLLVQGQLGSLVIEGKLNLKISDGTILYSAAEDGQGPDEPLPLETLIENMRSAEGS